MHLNRLISSIVRQTTVLVARLSTAGGSRSPLSQIANEVFLGLVTELERQGLGKKVAADMFGLALRSYQLKVQRLQESASDGGVTLWSAVRSFIEQRGAVARSEIVKRFGHDDEASIRGILNDLVESGLVYRAGRGDSSIYRVTPRDDLEQLAASDSPDTMVALVWLTVCQNGPISRSAIAEACSLTVEAVDEVLGRLIADGRVRGNGAEHADAQTFSADRCLIPIGDEAGWEAALLDHHQAVLNALAAKIVGGARSSRADDETGGATYRFELWPGHPEEGEVRGLLQLLRTQAAGVWDRVSAHNAQAKKPKDKRYSVVVYVGQHLRQEDEEA